MRTSSENACGIGLSQCMWMAFRFDLGSILGRDSQWKSAYRTRPFIERSPKNRFCDYKDIAEAWDAGGATRSVLPWSPLGEWNDATATKVRRFCEVMKVTRRPWLPHNRLKRPVTAKCKRPPFDQFHHFARWLYHERSRFLPSKA